MYLTAQSLVNEILSYYFRSMAKSSLIVKMGKKKKVVQTIKTILLGVFLCVCVCVDSPLILSNLVKPPILPHHPYHSSKSKYG